jgi:hypothetical protein
MKNKSLIEDHDHFKACHERWSERLNRDQNSPEYKDEWWAEQCLQCRFFIPLVGVFIEDYGACSNPLSPCDGTVRFEHDGCEHFSEVMEWWGVEGNMSEEL